MFRKKNSFSSVSFRTLGKVNKISFYFSYLIEFQILFKFLRHSILTSLFSSNYCYYCVQTATKNCVTVCSNFFFRIQVTVEWIVVIRKEVKRQEFFLFYLFLPSNRLYWCLMATVFSLNVITFSFFLFLLLSFFYLFLYQQHSKWFNSLLGSYASMYDYFSHPAYFYKLFRQTWTNLDCCQKLKISIKVLSDAVKYSKFD